MADNATLSTWETFYGNYRDPRSLTAFYFVLVASSGLVIVLDLLSLLSSLCLWSPHALVISLYSHVLVIQWVLKQTRVSLYWRHKLAGRYNHSWVSRALLVFIGVLSLLTAGLFFYEVQEIVWAYQICSAEPPANETTPTPPTDETLDCTDRGLAWILYEPWLIYLQFVISTVFLFDYIRELLFVPIRASFIFSPISIGEMLNIPAGLIAPFVGYYYYGFQCLGILQFFEVLLKMQKIQITTCGLSRNMWNIIVDMVAVVVAVLSLFYITLSFTFVLENVIFTVGLIDNLFVSLYFTTTFSTVGYGDITPQTDLGKIVIVLGVLSVIFLILPFAIGRISKRVKDIRIQMSVFPGENHLILWCPDAFCGDFIEEYFMRWSGVWQANVALMTNDRKKLDSLDVYQSSKEYKLRSWAFSGDLTSDESLRRAAAGVAEYAIILAAKCPHADYAQCDASAVMAVSKLLNKKPNCRIYAQLQNEVHSIALQRLLPSSQFSVLGVHDCKMALMALTCRAPGLHVLFANCFRSDTDAIKAIGKRNLHSWAYEYYVGFTRQFWTNFPLASFAGRSFAEAAYDLYMSHHTLLIGVYRPQRAKAQRMDVADDSEDEDKIFESLDAAMEIDYNAPLFNPGHTFTLEFGDLGICISPWKKMRDLQKHVAAKQGQKRTLRTQANTMLAELVSTQRDARQYAHATKENRPPPVKASTKRTTSVAVSVGGAERDKEKSEAQGTRKGEDDKDGDGGDGGHTKDKAVKKKRKDRRRVSSDSDEDQLPALTRAESRNVAEGEHELLKRVASRGVKTKVPIEWSQKTVDLAKTGSLECENHILVCDQGPDEGKLHLLRNLRRHTPPHDPDMQAVIFLQPTPPKTSVWKYISLNFPNVYFLLGSPSNVTDLKRTSFESAAVIIISGFGINSSASEVRADAEAASLMIYRLLERANAFALVELVHVENIEFLTPDVPSLYSPHYAGGHIFPMNYFDRLLAQAYTKPGLVEMFKHLITDASFGIIAVTDLHLQTLSEKTLSFGMLVELMLPFNMIPLGLYRYSETNSVVHLKKSRKDNPSSAVGGDATLARTTKIMQYMRRSMKRSRKKQKEQVGFRERYVYCMPDQEARIKASDLIYVMFPQSDDVTPGEKAVQEKLKAQKLARKESKRHDQKKDRKEASSEEATDEQKTDEEEVEAAETKKEYRAHKEEREETKRGKAGRRSRKEEKERKTDKKPRAGRSEAKKEDKNNTGSDSKSRLGQHALSKAHLLPLSQRDYDTARNHDLLEDDEISGTTVSDTDEPEEIPISTRAHSD